MTRTQRIILLVGLVILVVMWVFPPWMHYFPDAKSSRQPRTQRGYFFVADTRQGEPTYPPNLIMRIDFGRLLVQSVAVSLITAAAFFALRPNPQNIP